MNATQRYPVGTKYARVGKPQDTGNPWTVTDFHVTRNLAGDIVTVRYVAEKPLLGRMITDWDVLETTIARGLVE